MTKLTNEQKMHILSTKIDLLTKRGKIFTNQEVYAWIEWNYGKKRWWTDKYILPQLKWKYLKAKYFPYEVLSKYMHLDDLRKELKSILNDYSY